MYQKLLLTGLLVAATGFAAERGEEIKLWPNGAPGSEGITAAEVSTASKTPKYKGLADDYLQTHYPSIYVFLPPKEKATGASMIVAPGGGHNHLVIEKEGWEIADYLNERGIAAFVLKYRLAKPRGVPQTEWKYKLEDQVYLDAARSVRLVRSRATEYGIDPTRIGFIGFSAGGEVGGMIGTRFDAGKPNSTDPIERASSRPDFNILVYPWYRPGANIPNAPPLFPVPKDAPPTFMVCTTEDRSHVEPTVKFYSELLTQGVPVEMLIFADGPHGYALRPTAKPLPVNTWPDRMMDWLNSRSLLRKQ